jgi:hypothetical protein
MILIDKLLDFLSVKPGLLERLSSSAVREGHCCNLLHILLGHSAPPF